MQFDELYKITHEQQDKIRELEGRESNDISLLQRDLAELRSTNLQITQQFNAVNQQKQNYEEKTLQLSRELERLNSILERSKHKEGDIEYLHQRLHEYEEEIANLKEDAELIQQKYTKLYYTYQ